MPDFNVIRIDEFNTDQPVYKLVRNGKCKLDEVIREIEGNSKLEAEFAELYAILEAVANRNGILPKQRYRKLQLSEKLKYTGYECKSKHLRLYVFHEKGTGQIIAFCGTKGDQDEDLKRFEKLLKDYQNSKG